MRKINFIFVKSAVVYILLLGLILFSAAKPESYILAGKNALSLCFNTIIPSLFPFFVFSQILIKTGFAECLKSYASFICRPLFNVNGSGALAFIIGILSGYPAGAATCCELYNKGLINRTEARRLLPFCNNSGPLFIIGAVGSAMLGSAKVGIFLYIVHIISALLTGICFRFYGCDCEKMKSVRQKNTQLKAENINYSLGKVFSESVERACTTILNICGFIVIFSCLIGAITPLISALLKNPTACFLVRGSLEITLGIGELSLSDMSFSLKILLSSCLLGFGGICVFLQVAGIVSKTDIGMKTYIAGKILQSFFSAVISGIFIKSGALPVFLQNQTAAVYTFSQAGYITIFFIILVFLHICIKKRKLF